MCVISYELKFIINVVNYIIYVIIVRLEMKCLEEDDNKKLENNGEIEYMLLWIWRRWGL